MQPNTGPMPTQPPREPSMGVARSLNFATPAVQRLLPSKLDNAQPQRPAAKKEQSVVSASSEQTPTSASIGVFLRIRPLNTEEQMRDAETSIIPSKNKHDFLITPKEPMKHPPSIRRSGHAKFRFSHIFPQETSQEDVFERTTLPLIEGLFNELSAVVFAYGVTCSGKTWTIQGSPDNPGILPRALDVIMNSIAMAKGHGLLQDSNISEPVAELTQPGTEVKRRQRARAAENKAKHDANYVDVKANVEYKLYASYIEVYNEFCYDLFDSANSSSQPDHSDDASHAAEPLKNEPFVLAEGNQITTFISNPEIGTAVKPRRRPVLKLKEDAQGEVYGDGQTEVEIKSVVDVERLLEYGQQNRSVAATKSNEHSSRSHAIFIVTLKQTETIPQPRGPPKTRHFSSKLHIVDLAGSEKTSKAASSGLQKQESRNINTSLMNLSRCLEALRHNSQASKQGSKKPRIVPYRDSRLTRLLQHPLSAGAAVMIATAAPTLDDADETIHTLRNAAVAREVKLPVAQRRRVLADMSNIPSVSQSAKPPVHRPGLPERLTKTRSATVSRQESTRRVESKKDLIALRAKYEALEKEFEAVVKENKGLVKEKKDLTTTLEESEKERGILKLEREEEEIARMEVEKELEKLFRESDALRDKLADASTRVRTIEVEIREDAVREVDEIAREMEERYESQLAELQKKLDDTDRPHVRVSQSERRQTAERIARRLTRSSCAALQIVANNLREDPEEDSVGGSEEEYLLEDEAEYEEEE